MFDWLIQENNTFELFSRDHFWTLVCIGLVTALLVLLGKKSTPSRQDLILKSSALLVSFTVLWWTAIRLYLGEFNHLTDLPIFLCNLLGLLIPLLAFSKNATMYQVYYYLVIGGSTQALLTPSLVENFPHFTFLKFWLVHGGIVAIVLYMTIVLKMRPTLRGVWLTFLWAQVYLIGTMLLNFLLGANYCFLNQKPMTGSFLDLFGPWPNYLLVTDLVLMPFFALFYIPFWIENKRKAKIQSA